MAIGRTSHTSFAVRLHYIEACPASGNPFKGSVFSIVDTALTYYGFLLNAQRATVVDADPGVVPLYESFGYKPDGRANCLSKELE